MTLLEPDLFGKRRRFKAWIFICTRTAAYGHFGHPAEDDGGFSWERTDLARALVENLG